MEYSETHLAIFSTHYSEDHSTEPYTSVQIFKLSRAINLDINIVIQSTFCFEIYASAQALSYPLSVVPYVHAAYVCDLASLGRYLHLHSYSTRSVLVVHWMYVYRVLDAGRVPLIRVGAETDGMDRKACLLT
jgi:hypothetical protein